MTDVQAADQRCVLRWGGAAGILGSVIFVLVFVIVAVFVGSEPAETAELVERFPDDRAAHTVENGLYLVVLILWTVHFLALYQALRQASLGPALFGSVVGIVGLTVLAAGALPHVATLPISDRYQAAGASPEERATLVSLWDATQGLFDALFITGLAVLPIALIVLGIAMLAAPAFGTGVGRLSIGLGVLGVIAAVVLLIEPESDVAFVGVFALIVFHFALGRRVLGLSGDPSAATLLARTR
jgi:Domain of unknown function (DUF4386)